MRRGSSARRVRSLTTEIDGIFTRHLRINGTNVSHHWFQPSKYNITNDIIDLFAWRIDHHHHRRLYKRRRVNAKLHQSVRKWCRVPRSSAAALWLVFMLSLYAFFVELMDEHISKWNQLPFEVEWAFKSNLYGCWIIGNFAGTHLGRSGRTLAIQGSLNSCQVLAHCRLSLFTCLAFWLEQAVLQPN